MQIYALTLGVVSADGCCGHSLEDEYIPTAGIYLSRDEALKGLIKKLSERFLEEEPEFFKGLMDIAGLVWGELDPLGVYNLEHDRLLAWLLSQSPEAWEHLADYYFSTYKSDECMAFWCITELAVTLPENMAAAVVMIQFDGAADSVSVQDGVHQAVDIAVGQGFLTSGDADEGPAYVGHIIRQL